MRYKRFVIQNYKAIKGPLEINIERNKLIPIIGVNECGKTTILNAILAFDYFNDKQNEDGNHLADIHNLYSAEIKKASIAAEIEIGHDEFRGFLKEGLLGYTEETTPGPYKKVRRKEFPSTLTITRDLETRKYSFDLDWLPNAAINHAICLAIVAKLPYILYFDDFRDSIEEQIEIKTGPEKQMSGWLAIVEELFKQTSPSYSVLQLPTLEDRRRKTILSQVQGKLNRTLTEQWRNFRLDENQSTLRINIDYKEESVIKVSQPAQPNQAATETTESRHYIKFEVIERDSEGNEHFFYIRNRSKGFYWFFNFVMKLEFNPKHYYEGQYGAIYLLDEPGSYLHASAQAKLCGKLADLTNRNVVIYCTHSHYLLDPETIPINCIRISERGQNEGITLSSIHEYQGSIEDKRSAFQPIIDALQVKPFTLEFSGIRTVVVEGIYDFHAFQIFKGNRELNILPATGADSIKYLISVLIAWGIDYRALFDNDDSGRAALNDAREHFGDREADDRFRLLPTKGKTKKRILQDLFAGGELKKIREGLAIPPNSSFEKTIAALYYSDNRTQILKSISRETKANFAEVLDMLF